MNDACGQFMHDGHESVDLVMVSQRKVTGGLRHEFALLNFGYRSRRCAKQAAAMLKGGA